MRQQISKLPFKVRYVTSYRDIEIVLHDPDIVKKLGHEVDIENLPEMTYIGCYFEHKIASIFCFDSKKKAHFYCLKLYRRQAVELARESLKLAPPGCWGRVTNKNLENFWRKLGYEC